MSYYFSFIFLFLIIHVSFPFVDSLRYNSEVSLTENLIQCFRKYPKNENNSMVRCFLNETKNDTDSFISILKHKEVYSLIQFALPDNLVIKEVINFLEESLINGTELIDYIGETLKYKNNSSNLTFFDHIENLLDVLDRNPIVFINVFERLSPILKIEGLNKIYSYIMNKDGDFIFKIIELVIGNQTELQSLYNLILKTVGKYKKEIINLYFILIKNYFDRNEVIKSIAGFLKDNKDAHESIKKLIKEEHFKKIVNDALTNPNPLMKALKGIIFEREEALDLVFQLLNDTEIIDEGSQLIINISNHSFIYENLPSFIQHIVKKNESILFKFVRNMMYVAADLKGKSEFIKGIKNDIKISIIKFIDSRNINYYNISEDCTNLIQNIFLNTENNTIWDETVYKYIRKFIFDSPINKGDFMAYDNCLNEDPINIKESKTNNSYQLIPVFVIGIIDEKEKYNFTETIFYEKYHYITNYCFPFGIKKNTTHNEINMCSDSDYNKMLKFLFDQFSYNEDRKVSNILWHDINIKLEKKDYIIGILSIIIISIPIIIKICLMIIKYISRKRNKKSKKINKLLDGKNMTKFQSYSENEFKTTKKSNLSKCQKLLDNCFSFYNNGKELFNFNLNNTNFNNINGITYIKGLIGISIIFNVFGLTFTVLMNLQMKDYGIWHFYRTNHSLLFVFLYIGYRYSPRVLLSCSGYTLVYKYLCFIEQEKGLYFLKFFFLQSYKYILLYFLLIIFRYSNLRIMFLFRSVKRPAWALFEYFLEREDFLFSAFSLLFNFSNDNDNSTQNLIYNFYIPINEIFLFILGTILISLGYKFKLRIDIIIIIFILFFFIFKIISYLTFKGSGYITTDYYTSKLGIMFINPLYNIPFYLTGMYFGLINYSIQKGITNIYKENQYKKYYQLEESNKNNDTKGENTTNNSLSINSEDDELNENDETKNENINNDISLDKYLSKKEKNFEDKNINTNSENEKELNDQIKVMPFLKSPIQFFNFNRKHKENICYKILISLSVLIMILLCYAKSLFVFSISNINKDKMIKENYVKNISLEYVISNPFLNILSLIDPDIIVFLSHWIIFILFLKEVALIRDFCNSIYWSFFVKSYYTYLLVSVPVIICILYESESVIKLHIYNFIFFSLINIVFIFIFVVLFYSIFELPLKKIFKNLLLGNEIIDEEDEENGNEREEEEEEEKEGEEKEEENKGFYDEDDMMSLLD